MSANTNWLVQYPNQYVNGGGLPRNRFLGAMCINDYWSANLFNLLFASTIFNNWQFIFGNVKDWVTGLIWYPFTVPCGNDEYYIKYGPIDTKDQGTDRQVVGKVPLFLGGYNELHDMGNVQIPTYFNNFMDYTGYTQISVYLPYYGYIDIVPNDVIGKYLFVNLFIDYYTGKGLYYISVGDTSTATMSSRRILLTKETQIGYQIPLGGSNSIETSRNMLLGSIKTIGTIATLGLLGGSTAHQVMSGTNETTTSNVIKQGRKNISPKSVETVKRNYSNTRDVQYKIGGGIIGSAAVAGSADAISNAHMSAQSDKPSNALLTMAGPKSVKVVIKRPKPIAITNDYNKLYGKPACYTAQLSTLTGFTTISAIHLEGFSTATKEELRILEQTLLGGIIL